jgi:hypothetical protein
VSAADWRNACRLRSRFVVKRVRLVASGHVTESQHAVTQQSCRLEITLAHALEHYPLAAFEQVIEHAARLACAVLGEEAVAYPSLGDSRP